jgi:hypothetical protein
VEDAGADNDFVPCAQGVVATCALHFDACGMLVVVEENLHGLGHWVDGQRRPGLDRVLEEAIF